MFRLRELAAQKQHDNKPWLTVLQSSQREQYGPNLSAEVLRL